MKVLFAILIIASSLVVYANPVVTLTPGESVDVEGNQTVKCSDEVAEVSESTHFCTCGHVLGTIYRVDIVDGEKIYTQVSGRYNLPSTCRGEIKNFSACK